MGDPAPGPEREGTAPRGPANEPEREGTAPRPPRAQVGLREGARVFVVRTSSAQQRDAAAAEADRAARLARLTAAAAKLTGRGDGAALGGRLPELSLEAQDGRRLELGAADRQALVLGLLMDRAGQQAMSDGDFGLAARALEGACESFALCESDVVSVVDNPAMAALSLAWCYFRLRDASRLAAAAGLLRRARAGLERAHGGGRAAAVRARGGLSALATDPDAPTYARLELLEGIAAFHRGEREVARRALTSARERLARLDPAPGDVEAVRGAGATEREARRALALCGGSVADATALLAGARAARDEAARRREADRRLWREQRRYGRSEGGAAPDMDLVSRLSAGLGFDRAVAAEALKASENSHRVALELLLNDHARRQLEERAIARAALVERRQARGGGAGPGSPAAAGARPGALGPRSEVAEAVDGVALALLLSAGLDGAPLGSYYACHALAAGAGDAGAARGLLREWRGAGCDLSYDGEGPPPAAGASGSGSDSGDADSGDADSWVGSEDGSGGESGSEGGDPEAEAALAAAVAGAGPAGLDDYALDLAPERAAADEYLALLGAPG